MASLLSPGVLTREIDLTTVVPAGATTEAGIAILSHWGPVDETVLITSESELVEIFGKPSDDNAARWFTAKNFLSYSSSLYVVRTTKDGGSGNPVLNSGIDNLPVLIKNEDAVDSHSTGERLCARCPGVLGDSLKIFIADATSLSTSSYKGEFANSELETDELHILVIDEDGLFSGVKNTILEKYEFLSKKSDAKKRDGSSNYYKNVINTNSEYIWILNDYLSDWGKPHDEVLDPAGSLIGSSDNWDLDAAVEKSLEGGADGLMKTSEAKGELNTAYDKFKDDELIDISFLLCADGGKEVADYLLEIANYRKDCLVVVSPDVTDVISDTPKVKVETFRKNLNLGGIKDLKSSYMVMDDNWKYQFDRYNNVNRWVPCNGDTAGIMAETDAERAPWASPGGRTLQNVIKLAWKSNRSERDDLYPLGINSITTFPGEGALLFGDRTLLQRPSAFDRINVRRLFIYLRKIVSRASRSLLFEQNTEFTRRRFVNLVEPILREIQGRQGITDFRVVCDSSNNPGNIVDQNRFVGDIYIKPTRSINFIELNFVAVRTDVDFEEVVGNI